MPITDLTPYLDPELVAAFTARPHGSDVIDVRESRRLLRQVVALVSADLDAGDDVHVSDLQVPATGDRPAVPVRVFTPARRLSSAVLAWYHGGGFYAGHHEDEGLGGIPWVRETGCTIVSIGYRQPPEHPYPAAIDDGMAVLDWLVQKPAPLGFEPERLAVGGLSAGGCLAAATALKARDRGGPGLCFQLLLEPALDNHSNSPSMLQLQDNRAWRRATNIAAWTLYAGTGEVAPYASPARASDLSRLPPAYIEVAAMDSLRDEAITYAQRLMAAGVTTELHVYPGAYHASSWFQKNAAISRRAQADTVAALKRALG